MMKKFNFSNRLIKECLNQSIFELKNSDPFIKRKCLSSTLVDHQQINQKNINHLNRSINNQENQGKKSKLILGIETSCDDTCAAVLDTNREILSNEKDSQTGYVIDCGGVMTVNAIRLHSTAIHDVVLNSLKKAGVKSFKELTAIAVTTKPGQITSLDIGTDYAKSLALNYNLPLIPIHHMEAHALTAMICYEKLQFPFLSLLISGGHSQIVLFKSIDLIYLIGNSFDCGPGEVIDKIARKLKLKNLGKPFDRQSGGQSVEILAKLVSEQSKRSEFNKIHKSKKKMKNLSEKNECVANESDKDDLSNDKKYRFADVNRKKTNNCNFNYGGIRTYFSAKIDKLRGENERYPINTIKPSGFKSVDIDTPLDETCFICHDLQSNLVRMFSDRLERSIRFIEMTNILNEDVKQIEDIKLREIDYLDEKPVNLPLIVSGGVACNDTMMTELEQSLKSVKGFYEKTQFEFHLPRPYYLCTDNAVMIAWNGILKYLESLKSDCLSSRYVSTNKNEIENVKIQSDASLGIIISHLVKKLMI